MIGASWLNQWAEIAVAATAILVFLGMVFRFFRNLVLKLEAIDKAVNRQSPDEPPLVHRAKDIESHVLDLADEFNEKHNENSGRIENLEHHVAMLWVHVRHIGDIVGKVGRALGIDVPPPPLDKPERKT